MNGGQRLLLVEDRDSLRRMLEHALSGEGWSVRAEATGEAAVEALGGERFNLVLTDLSLPGAASGMDVLEASRTANGACPVVVMTAYGSVATAVEAMKRGAADFLEKPVELDTLFALLERLAVSETETQLFEVAGASPIVGRHPLLRAALRLLERVAPTDSSVLLVGESGTGKELFARALHGLSSRAAGPFVAVNCAAIPEALIENELFGHERGAYTGAHRQQAGRFEQAERGTLFLDEVGELPLAVQGKLLRALEERTYQRVGGGATRRADLRLVAATNRELSTMVDAGTFRSDLFFRLEVFPVRLPPLRERLSDLPALAHHLLDRLASRHELSPPVLTEPAQARLAAEPWPGNVRQLANVLERLVILHPGERLGGGEIEALLSPLVAVDEREDTRRALLEADGDARRAAELLGIGYRKVLERIKRFDLAGYPRYRG